jgi:hypothetical protein
MATREYIEDEIKIFTILIIRQQYLTKTIIRNATVFLNDHYFE